jgi:hypothetical protein
MGFETLRRLLPLVFAASCLTTLRGQDAIPAARTILDLRETEQIAFINRTMDLGFPENRADQMTMLIINRSAMTLPLIETKLEEALKSRSTPKAFVDTAAEMIAYAGDEVALRAIAKLVVIDEEKFGPLVGRTLDNAKNWRNPMNVAYQGLAIGREPISGRIVAWAEGALASDQMQRAWAEAMLDRYGRVPDESDWVSDPIASHLKSGVLAKVRQSVRLFAEGAYRNRHRR